MSTTAAMSSASSSSEQRLREEYLCFAKFIGLNMNSSSTALGNMSAAAAVFGGDVASSTSSFCSSSSAAFPTLGAQLHSSTNSNSSAANGRVIAAAAAATSSSGGRGAPLGSTTAPNVSPSTAQLIANLNGCNSNDDCGSGGGDGSLSSSSSSPLAVFESLPIALVKLVVDDIKLKLFRAFGEGACEYLLQHGALPPLVRNIHSGGVNNSYSSASADLRHGHGTATLTNTASVGVGAKRFRSDDDGVDASSSSHHNNNSAALPLSSRHPHAADGGFRGVGAHHQSLSSSSAMALPPPSSLPDVSVKLASGVSPNTMIAKLLAKQEEVKRQQQQRSWGSALGGDDGEGGSGRLSTTSSIAGGDGGGSGGALVFADEGGHHHQQQQTSSLHQNHQNVNPKFAHHVFSAGVILSREELCRIISAPLPEPIAVVVTAAAAAAPSSVGGDGGVGDVGAAAPLLHHHHRLVMPPAGAAGGVPRVFSHSNSNTNYHHPHPHPPAALLRFPTSEADRLLLLKEQEELIQHAINAAKHRNADTERKVFLVKDACEKANRLWRQDMAKEEALLKSLEMGVLEARRKIDKSRLELKRSQMEEERLSKIIRTARAK